MYTFVYSKWKLKLKTWNFFWLPFQLNRLTNRHRHTSLNHVMLDGNFAIPFIFLLSRENRHVAVLRSLLGCLIMNQFTAVYRTPREKG